MKTTTLTTALAAGAGIGLLATGALAEVTTVSPERIDRLPVDLLTGIQYASNDHGFGRDQLYFDLLRPVTDEPTPVVVFVLGSGWTPIQRERVLPQLTFLAEAGFAVATVDYRGIGEGNFPTAQEDVKRAIRYIRANANTYNIDPDAIGLLGNSAGGHISLIAGLSDEEDFRDAENPEPAGGDSSVQAIGAIYPAVTFGTGGGGNPVGVVNQHFGFVVGDPANAEALAPGLVESHLDANDPPLFIIQGDADPVVPLESSQWLYDAAEAAGMTVDMLIVEGLGHSIEDTMTTRQVEDMLIDFYDTNLRGGAE